MSITPYNNFTVRDLNNVQKPYINSTAEFGYFTGNTLTITAANSWYSLPVVLNTNNGIASVDAVDGGLKILNAGVYKIKLSLFPTATNDGSSNISFNFGTTYLPGVSTGLSASAFGGARTDGMFTYDPFNNSNIPGIISWVADGYSSGSATISNFIKNSTTNELSYNYFNVGYPGNALYSGICTTKMTFILDSQKTIYFNVSSNSTSTPSVTMGNCSFTLELISTSSFKTTLNAWNFFKIVNVPSSVKWWRGVSSSSTGQYLSAVNGVGGFIYTSTNFGVNWNQGTNAPSAQWRFIASSRDGQYYVAVATGVPGAVWRSTDYGVTWSLPSLLPSPNSDWTGVASSETGSQFVITSSTRGIWKSTDYGNSWFITSALTTIAWNSIASSFSGQKLAACSNAGGIWVSTDNGSIWTITNATNTINYYQIVSSSNGDKLAATIFEGSVLIRSTDYGSNWTTSAISGQYKTSIASSSDGNILAYVGYTGGISYSVNQGNTWTIISNFIPNPEAFGSVALSSDGKRIVFATRYVLDSPTVNDGVFIGVLS